ncbi:extracellular solute-binding protein [Nonomuraea endophytica]|uniref:extracellular solute-binding protein n=1 Tax=Nonomuraea endophytica TaxID=714136 RepID=UPI0037CB71D7
MLRVTLALALVALNGGCAPETKPPPATQAEAWRTFVSGLRDKWRGETLRIISWHDNDAAERLIPEFERLTGADVRTEFHPYQTTYLLETFLGSSRSSSQDIFVIDMPWVGKMATAEYVEPLNPYLARTPEKLVDYRDYFKVMTDGAVWDQDITGLPYTPVFVFNIYNKQLLRRAGVSPPRDFDDLVRVAAAATDKANGRYGVVMNNQTGTAVGQAYFEYIYNMGGKPFASEYPGSPDYYADMTPQFTSPQSIAVVNLFKRLLKYQPPGKLNVAWEQRFDAFAQGRAALMSTWNFDIAPLLDPKLSKVGDDFGVQPVPRKKGARLNTPVGGWQLAISRQARNKDLAWDFMVWFTSPQIGVKFASAGGFPTRYSVLGDPDLARRYPYYTILRRVVDTAFPGFRPQIPESFDVIEVLGTWIAKALYGELSTEEAMARANQDVGLLLKEAGYTVRGV